MGTIDLINFLPKETLVYSGRPNGQAARKQYKVDSIDKNDECYEVLIPKETLSFNPSFFLGMFGDSIRTLRKEKFNEKYVFKCDIRFLKTMEIEIDRCLKTSKVL